MHRVSEYFQVQSAQVTALIERNTFEFDAELKAAQECKDAAKRAPSRISFSMAAKASSHLRRQP